MDKTILGASERLRRRSIVAGVEIPKEKVKRRNSILKRFIPSKPQFSKAKKKETVVSRVNDMVICFIDIDSFTSYTRDLEPVKLVEMLNNYMQTVDRLIKIFRLRKIKTIGDGYMICTRQEQGEDLGSAVARMCDMVLFLQGLLKEDDKYCGGHRLTVRAGIHVGEVVAGLIGIEHVTFDIFGPAVNRCSRLESTCKASSLQVSERVMQLTKSVYKFEKSTALLKGFGSSVTYIIKGSARI